MLCSSFFDISCWSKLQNIVMWYVLASDPLQRHFFSYTYLSPKILLLSFCTPLPHIRSSSSSYFSSPTHTHMHILFQIQLCLFFVQTENCFIFYSIYREINGFKPVREINKIFINARFDFGYTNQWPVAIMFSSFTGNFCNVFLIKKTTTTLNQRKENNVEREEKIVNNLW